ncbi:MAG: tRNA nucleotidyltransferase (CCA-adding enzyme) [Nitrospirae bacterium]|nr:MAG: tRNA nucleotidyltransferase (CCA-adding enzyme) [Nitrospirota bacterium]
MDVITSHLNADFDALASAIAAKKLYPDAIIVFPGSLEKRVREFVEIFNPAVIQRMKDIDPAAVKRLIIVDTKHPDRIGPLKDLLTKPGLKVHVYDHHPVTAEDIRGELSVLDTVGAVSTLFTEIIQKKKIVVSPLEATMLCLGIYEETGSLMFASTTPRDLIAAAYLLKRGANLNIVSRFLKEEISKEEVSLLNELMQSLREVVLQGVRVKIARGSMEGFGDVAHLAHRILDSEDADAVVLMIGMADKVLLVGRSKVPELNVGKALMEFGGGGHGAAASATIKDMPFELIEERLLAALEKSVRPMKTAQDVMTAPVVTIQWDSRIKEAESTMTKYGVNALPVVKGDTYIGIITRELVEKALFHGLGRNHCEDFATTDAITVAPDANMPEVEKSMIEQNQRFVSVVEEGRVKGAITRTDILRVLYEDYLRKSRVGAGPRASGDGSAGYVRHVAQLLREELPPPLYAFLERAGAVADELGSGAYLVGGSVRDLLRRERNLDLDIVVEGDGIQFARRLGEEIGAKVTVHERFGTAVVSKEDFKLDVATARTEYYESPAALPKVESSSIKKDLYRRDFTINTLAVRLNRKDFGLLIDFFGGQRDLKEKAVRVLHNLSFVEDPTRTFRAIRFAERFGFRLTKHTENLIKLAIRMNIFDKLAGSRLFDELELICRETNPTKAFSRLGDFEMLRVIHPRLAYTPELEALLQSVHDVITWFDMLYLGEKYDKGVLYIMALLSGLNRAERESALVRLSVTEKPKEKILRGLGVADSVMRLLQPHNPVAVYHLLIQDETEALLFVLALARDAERKRAISDFLLKHRSMKPFIRGEDLKQLGIAPGPKYSEIFRAVLDERIRGTVVTKEDEIALVKRSFCI